MGAHERSPMYQALLTEDLLDLVNLAGVSGAVGAGAGTVGGGGGADVGMAASDDASGRGVGYLSRRPGWQNLGRWGTAAFGTGRQVSDWGERIQAVRKGGGWC